MSEHIARTLEDAERKLLEQQGAVKDTKKLINGLCQMMGQPSRYTDLDEPAIAATGTRRGDEYYGKALAWVVRNILENRNQTGLGPASVNELYAAMTKGGYRFETDVEENAKRGLRISLGKNSTTFHKLPTGKFGLREWYPAIKDSKEKNGRSEKAAELDETDLEEARAARCNCRLWIARPGGREIASAAVIRKWRGDGFSIPPPVEPAQFLEVLSFPSGGRIVFGCTATGSHFYRARSPPYRQAPRTG